MAWCDYQRYAQGYIIRHHRHLEGVRKTAYWTLIGAGAKRVRERQLFTLLTDPEIPQIKEEDKLTAEQLQKIADRYKSKFDKAKNKR